MRTSAVALVALAVIGCSGPGPSSRSTAVAEPLAQLTLPLLDGGTWSSTSARGSVVVIDVWASWCKPCSEAFPRLNALAARRPDVVVIALSIDQDVEAARAFIAQFPLTVTIARDTQHAIEQLKVRQLPALVIIDAAGVIRRRIEKPSDRDYDRIEELIAAP